MRKIFFNDWANFLDDEIKKPYYLELKKFLIGEYSTRKIFLSRSLKNLSGVEVVGSVEELFNVLDAAEENFVIGGAEVFNELIPYAEEIFLTVVDAEAQADVFFPNVDEFTLKAAQIFDGFEFGRYTR